MRGTTKTKKKITEVKAFKTANGCIWENEIDILWVIKVVKNGGKE